MSIFDHRLIIASVVFIVACASASPQPTNDPLNHDAHEGAVEAASSSSVEEVPGESSKTGPKTFEALDMDRLDEVDDPSVRRFEVRLTLQGEEFPDIPNYASASFAQRVTREGPNTLLIETAVVNRLPESDEPIPAGPIAPEFERYLEPTPRVQSDDPRIAALAQAILDERQPQTLSELVAAVTDWTARNIAWGDPNDIPDAITAIDNKRANCIGFTHAAAAILRHLGIPVRNARTFFTMHAGERRGLTRHYVLEVYFPEVGHWVTVEPQEISGLPWVGNIYLYHDPDWNQGLHVVTRDFSRHPQLQVDFIPTPPK